MIEGRGTLGLLMIKAGLGYNEANELLEMMELVARKKGFEVTCTQHKNYDIIDE